VGIADLGELPATQQAMLLGIIRMSLHYAVDLVDNPDRSPGWTYTDPAILDGFGRGSAMIPGLIASAHPGLAEVTSFLDVGTGVGLLAVAAANVWPKATVVGIDLWEPALERARPNVVQAGLEDRITLRHQDLADLDDVDTYDCAWIPTFFLTEPVLEAGLAAVVRALRPGGWVVLGLNRPTPDPLAAAVAALRWTRGGGGLLDGKDATNLLEAAGCGGVHSVPPAGPTPIELILGQRPTS
jgi:SAM-dependent methyltransferase